MTTKRDKILEDWGGEEPLPSSCMASDTMTTKHTHTAEPWSLFEERREPTVLIRLKAGAANIFTLRSSSLSGRTRDRANARRIVAAVNACAGISTEALGSGVIRELVDLLRELVTAGNANTRAAKDLMKRHLAEGVLSDARAVLAKVKP